MPYGMDVMNPGQGYGPGETDQFAQIMKMFGSTNPLMSAGIGAGTELLKGLAGLIGGPSAGEKRSRKVFNMAQNRMGQSVLNPDQYLADFMRTIAPQINNEATTLSRRVGLDSGVARGALFDRAATPLAEFMMNARKQNDILTSQRDDMLLQLMGSLGR